MQGSKLRRLLELVILDARNLAPQASADSSPHANYMAPAV
jgi:hypothetical protein